MTRILNESSETYIAAVGHDPHQPMAQGGVGTWWDETNYNSWPTSSASRSGVNVTAWTPLQLSAWWSGVNQIIDDVTKMPVELKRLTADGTYETDTNATLHALVSAIPNDMMSADDFWRRIMTWLMVYSNAYAMILRDMANKPYALIPLWSDNTYPRYFNGEKYYQTSIGRGTDREQVLGLLPSQVLHFETSFAFRYEKAEELIKYARQSVGLAVAQQNYASTYFRKGGRIGGHLLMPEDIGTTAADKIYRAFVDNYEGEENIFSVLPLRGGVNFQPGQHSPREIQMNEAREHQVLEVARWLRMPPSKLGVQGARPYKSKTEDDQDYLATTLRPYTSRITCQLGFKLLRREEYVSKRRKFQYDTTDAVYVSKKEEAETLAIYKSAELLTSNEAREQLNMPPHPDGDTLQNPNTSSPNTTATEPEPAEPTNAQRRAAAKLLTATLKRTVPVAKRLHKKADPNWLGPVTEATVESMEMYATLTDQIASDLVQPVVSAVGKGIEAGSVDIQAIVNEVIGP